MICAAGAGSITPCSSNKATKLAIKDSKESITYRARCPRTYIHRAFYGLYSEKYLESIVVPYFRWFENENQENDVSMLKVRIFFQKMQALGHFFELASSNKHSSELSSFNIHFH